MMKTILFAAVVAMPAMVAAEAAAPAAPQVLETREISPAQTPLAGQSLSLWQSNIWVSVAIGGNFNASFGGGDAELAQAVEGKKGGTYYYFASYRPGETPKRNVVLYVTSCEFGAMIEEKCSDKSMVGYEATDDGRLLRAWADGGKNLRADDPKVQADFVALRTMWLSEYEALYAETMDQSQLDKIFQCQGCVKPKS